VRASLAERVRRAFDITQSTQGEPVLEQRGDIVRLTAQQGFEFADRLLEMAERGIGPAQLPARVAVLGSRAGQSRSSATRLS
jgi:hypothetical protein